MPKHTPTLAARPEQSAKAKQKRHPWPQARRIAQAARMRVGQYWKQSTGPRSASGKARTAQNSLRHGYRAATYRAICAALAYQKQCVASWLALREAAFHTPRKSPACAGPDLSNMIGRDYFVPVCLSAKGAPG